MPSPEEWVMTLTFKDHEGKTRTFSKETSEVDPRPQCVYQTQGMRPDGSKEFYYSEDEPKKEPTGLLRLYELDGKLKYVEFTSVVIGLLPCDVKPFDEGSQKRMAYWIEYHQKHDTCPRHKESYHRRY